jgi:hypothetical protein
MTRRVLTAILLLLVGAFPAWALVSIMPRDKRAGDRVMSVVWMTNIPPGEFAEFGFIGRKSKSGGTIVWKVHQRYADGTASHWVGEVGTRSPAPTTTLTVATP